MSATGARLSPSPRIEADGARVSCKRKSALVRLLHALNQPLTGLQCSQELALAVPRRPEQYVQTLREGAGLTHRMRMLVEAMREVIDLQESRIPSNQAFLLQELLLEVIDELRPVAESRRVRITLDCDSTIAVASERGFFAGLIFRLIESLLGLAAADSEIGIAGRKHEKRIQLRCGWREPERERMVELCPAELGLLLVETSCERIGGRWERSDGDRRSCTMWLAPFSGEVHPRALEEAQ